MKFGAVFPSEIAADPVIIRDFVQAVEGMGYDHIVAYEQIMDVQSDNPPTAWQEPFTLFSYISAHTDKLELVIGISVAPARQTALLAKQAAQLDCLAGGRFRLGVSAGWHEAEFTAAGIDFKTRGKRLDEQITLLRDLWTKPFVSIDSPFHTMKDIGVYPQPVQQPIPVWVGGYADAALKRVAYLGAGWLAAGQTPESAREKFATIRRYSEEAGRDPNTIGLEIVDIDLGKAQDWQQSRRDWEEAGASYMAVTTRHIGLTTPQQHIDHLHDFIKAVQK